MTVAMAAPHGFSLPRMRATMELVGDSFSQFYEADRARLVRSLALTIGDPDLAAESVDEAMARAYDRWDKISTSGSPSAWVYRVAQNLATSRFRRLRRDRIYGPRIARPEDHIDVHSDKVLADALENLSKEHRDVLVLRYFLDWSVAEVAEALGVAVGTVKSRTSRALAELGENMGDDL